MRHNTSVTDPRPGVPMGDLVRLRWFVGNYPHDTDQAVAELCLNEDAEAVHSSCRRLGCSPAEAVGLLRARLNTLGSSLPKVRALTITKAGP